MKNKIVIYLCIFFLLFLNTGCSLFSDPSPDSEKALRSAWEYFEMKNYAMAHTKFESVIAIDADNAEAYNGRGWCSLLLNDVESSITDFKIALNKGNTSLAPHAGLAGSYISIDEFSQAIFESSYVIEKDANYAFEHEPEINYLDMHLILAMAYFHTGELQNAYYHICILDPDISIDENDSSTWVLNDCRYDSYAEVLMAIIDDLDVLYGFS